MNFSFRKAIITDLPLLDSWLQKPHVMEFWDNSARQYNNMKNYLEGHKEIHDYYIGFLENIPFCLLMTSYEDETTLPRYLPYVSKNYNTHTLDFMIGNEDYFGKGYGALTLQKFCRFIQAQDPMNTNFIIDPAATNPRAIHVYQKAGFEIVEEFTPDSGSFESIKHYLMIKKL